MLKCIFDLRTGHMDAECAEHVLELQRMIEDSPGASGLLRVQSVHVITNGDLQQKYDLAVKTLHLRASDTTFPKPSWRDEELEAVLKHDREVVLSGLMHGARPAVPERSVFQRSVYHGCPSWEVAQSIARGSFASNVQNTKGWYGEGVYTTTSPTYALRYAFHMREFWEVQPRTVGIVVVAQAAFAYIYPVTRADYTSDDPPECGLKGQRLKRGCDAHVVCVHRTPPYAGELRWTYHACHADQRVHATELVIQQESHLLPQFVVEVEVLNNPTKQREVQLAFQHGSHGQSCPGAPQLDARTKTNGERDDDAADLGAGQVRSQASRPSSAVPPAAARQDRAAPERATGRHVPDQDAGRPQEQTEPPPTAPTASDAARRQLGGGAGRGGTGRDAPPAGADRRPDVAASEMPSDNDIVATLRQAERPLPTRDVYLLSLGLDPTVVKIESSAKKAMHQRLTALRAAGQAESVDGCWRAR
uniref:PARP catalytic domain-containing protein n=1 Tax=Alexandrium monilatum TaxID=311494 RepID=A0A7S4SEH0_9DINO